MFPQHAMVGDFISICFTLWSCYYLLHFCLDTLLHLLHYLKGPNSSMTDSLVCGVSTHFALWSCYYLMHFCLGTLLHIIIIVLLIFSHSFFHFCSVLFLFLVIIIIHTVRRPLALSIR